MYSPLRRSIGNSFIQTQQRFMSFKVRVGHFETPKAPISERQRVQQTWCLSGGETLEKLRVATPGITFISVAPPSFFDEMAQSQNTSSNQLSVVARVSSDAQSLLERVDVLTRGSNRLLIGFDPRPPHGWPVEDSGESGKHLLTEIFVREASELRNVGAFGGGSLVVTDSEQGSVLVNDRPYGKLKLAAFGSRVFVDQEQALRLGRVSLFAGRGGQICLSAPEIIARDRIRAAAGRWEDSKILVQTPTLSTPSLGAAVTGSGRITFGSKSDSHCEKQTLIIAGNGSIDTGDITSRYGRVYILGSGSATLQASETMTMGTLGSGRVNYLEPSPDIMRGSTSSLRALSAAAKAQRGEDRAAITPPSRKNAFEDTGYSLNPWWWARRSFGFHPRNKDATTTRILATRNSTSLLRRRQNQHLLIYIVHIQQ
ncbi:hypothetical protein P3T76_009117 [Phytophthora citrophthora]|uniref:Uncharacterized protein n=1 Tax=Phytophthora citrophthora TaxID=4793 RepID=A0AAD9GID7_9STRA|nr:hypothetical protein P3T76_009117 [Phytophthora citrophthora]